MHFATDQTKNAGSSIGPAANTSKIGGEESLQGTMQKLSLGLTTTDILPHGVASWFTESTANDRAKAGGTLFTNHSSGGSMAAGLITNPTSHQGALVSPNADNSLHNLNSHTF